MIPKNASQQTVAAEVAPSAVTTSAAHRDETLSPSQRHIVDMLEEYPGATILLVSKWLQCTHSSAAYHLTALANRQIIVRERDGRKVRHYAAHSRDARHDLRLQALCRDENRYRIIEYLATNRLEMMTINRMAKALGVGFGLFKRTVIQLENEGYVECSRRRGRYSIRTHNDLVEAFHYVRDLRMEEAERLTGSV